MSDHASAHKSFNDLLAKYKANTLPTITENWETVTDEKKLYLLNLYLQISMSQMEPIPFCYYFEPLLNLVRR